LANPIQISLVCFLGADFTVVIVTAKYECFSDIPAVLRLKKDDATFSTADICPVRCWGEGLDSNDDNPGAGGGSGSSGGAPPGGALGSVVAVVRTTSPRLALHPPTTTQGGWAASGVSRCLIPCWQSRRSPLSPTLTSPAGRHAGARDAQERLHPPHRTYWGARLLQNLEACPTPSAEGAHRLPLVNLVVGSIDIIHNISARPGGIWEVGCDVFAMPVLLSPTGVLDAARRELACIRSGGGPTPMAALDDSVPAAAPDAVAPPAYRPTPTPPHVPRP
jgi:hypothetical protein